MMMHQDVPNSLCIYFNTDIHKKHVLEHLYFPVRYFCYPPVKYHQHRPGAVVFSCLLMMYCKGKLKSSIDNASTCFNHLG
jgi:hypothetical protein